jgi:tetratricopeptide (TPR) repeat protein
LQRWHWQGEAPEILIAAFQELNGLIENDREAEETREPLKTVAGRIYAWHQGAGKTHPGILKLVLAYLDNMSTEERAEPDILTMTGDAYYRLGNWGEAAAAFLTVIERTGASEATISLGKVYEASNLAGEAVALYERALEGGDNSVKLRYRLAVAAAANGEVDKSIAHYRSVIDSGLRLKEVFDQLAALYEQSGETELANECRRAASA